MALFSQIFDRSRRAEWVQAAQPPGRAQCRRRLSFWLAGSVLWGLHGLVQAGAGDAWVLVQPLEQLHLGDPIVRHVARLLPQYMGGKAGVQEAVRGKGTQALEWAVRQGPTDRTLVLMSPGRLEWLRTQGQGDAFTPLQLILHGNWCLTSRTADNGGPSKNWDAWLHGLKQPVQLGISQGELVGALWARAMAGKTRMDWRSTEFSDASLAGAALHAGKLDLLLERCAAISRHLAARAGGVSRVQVQALAKISSTGVPDAKPLGKWKLAPMAPGWLAWYVPSAMDPAQRKALADALYAILRREDTRELILELLQDPSSMTPEQSQRYIVRSLHDWRSVSALLENAAPPHAEVPGTDTARALPATR